MNYTTALNNAAQPDAPASAISDLMTVAAGEGIPNSGAIADRLALRAVLTAPSAADIDKADKVTTDAADALGNAKTKLAEAQRNLDEAEAQYVEAHAASNELHRQKLDATNGMKRHNVAKAAKELAQ